MFNGYTVRFTVYSVWTVATDVYSATIDNETFLWKVALAKIWIESTYTFKITINCASSSAKIVHIKRSQDFHHTTASIHVLSFSLFVPTISSSCEELRLERNARPSSATVLWIVTRFQSTDSLFPAIYLLEIQWHRTAWRRYYQCGPLWSWPWKAWDSFNYVYTKYRKTTLPRVRKCFTASLPLLIWSQHRLAYRESTISPATVQIQRINL